MINTVVIGLNTYIIMINYAFFHVQYTHRKRFKSHTYPQLLSQNIHSESAYYNDNHRSKNSLKAKKEEN